MKVYFIFVKREFWEHQNAFVILPLVIAALLVIASIYVVIMHSSADSQVGVNLMEELFNDDISSEDSSGEIIDFSGAESVVVDNDTIEYVIDFTRGELTTVENINSAVIVSDNRHRVVNAFLNIIHYIFITIIGLVLIFYLLSSLHTDRKDRSVMFWKSMPVSETQNVITKHFISALAVPVLVTLISWVAQICYVILAMIFVYRIGSDPWIVVWSQVDLLSAFYQQLIFVLLLAVWWLPLDAWLLFSSAFAKRSPFLVATIPVVMVFVLEYLLFGTGYVAALIGEHFQAASLQFGNYIGETIGGAGFVPIVMLNGTKIITGIVIAGLLLPATIWLRNNRFEI